MYIFPRHISGYHRRNEGWRISARIQKLYIPDTDLFCRVCHRDVRVCRLAKTQREEIAQIIISLIFSGCPTWTTTFALNRNLYFIIQET